MTLDELQTAVTKGQGGHRQTVRSTSGPTPATRTTASTLIREGVKVASFALAPKPDLIARLKDAGVVVIPSVGAAKHAKKVAGWGADAVIVQGGEGGPHRPGGHDAVAVGARRRRRHRNAGGRRGWVLRRSWSGRRVVVRRRRCAMGTRFLLTSGLTVPDDVKQRYLSAGLDGTVVSTRRRRDATSRAAHRPGGEARKWFRARFHRGDRQRAEVPGR